MLDQESKFWLLSYVRCAACIRACPRVVILAGFFSMVSPCFIGQGSWCWLYFRKISKVSKKQKLLRFFLKYNHHQGLNWFISSPVLIFTRKNTHSFLCPDRQTSFRVIINPTFFSIGVPFWEQQAKNNPQAGRCWQHLADITMCVTEKVT